MDDDLAKAIALSLQSAESESDREEKDLQRALELSRQSASQLPFNQSGRQQETMPSYDSKSKNNIPAFQTSDSNSSRIVEILSSDDEEMDPDLKLAIQLSKTAHSGNSRNENNCSTGLNSGFENSQNIIDEDMKLAIQLQKEFDKEMSKSPQTSKIGRQQNVSSLDSSKANLCDPEWERIDPNPDIHSLFVQFDQRFFWNSLGIVQLEWSKRMYTCAGICYYQRRGPHEQCNIRLSQPLLALRPRGDLVNTLIHEMIHAFLFVTHNDRDRDGHGPRFQAHMRRINESAGTNITIYHEWHEETDYYKKHIWRCNGPCRSKRPYFGFVKRVSNRKPGPNDRWFAQHQSSCGGVFEKIGEPTPKKRGPPKKRKLDQSESNTSSNGKNSDSRQPRIDVAMSRVARPAHVTDEATIQQTSYRESIDNLENKKLEKNGFGVGGNILGGKRDGISRLLFPEGKTLSQEKMGPPVVNSNLIKTKSGKQYKISDFFSSEED